MAILMDISQDIIVNVVAAQKMQPSFLLVPSPLSQEAILQNFHQK